MIRGRDPALQSLLALALLFVAPAPSVAADSLRQRELEYAYPDQSVWTTRTDEQGNPENPLLKLASAMFAKAGISWHGKRYPAARMFNYLNDGTAEFSILVNAPILKDCCLFSHAPVASTELKVYYLPSKPAIRDKEDLAGKRVITIRGYSYGGLLAFLGDSANNVTNNAAIRHDAAFAMLEAGRGDYLLDYAGPASEVLAEHPIHAIQQSTLSRLDVYMVLAKAYPDSTNVMKTLEAIAETLNRDEILGVSSH